MSFSPGPVTQQEACACRLRVDEAPTAQTIGTEETQVSPALGSHLTTQVSVSSSLKQV